ncbi:hypothetical protein AAG747_26615 [Rapidithrix thailandica]|uniref:Uncharacterized protein n=1 Tax=Rapidithrix thailandica TaxID=413964 RepID=A0AAW9S2W1_9BACT
MAIYFDIIISLKELFDKVTELKLDQVVDIFIEYRNDEKECYYKKVNPSHYQAPDFNHTGYQGFFIISKEAKFDGSRSPYDDEMYSYTIEIKGGRETGQEIEKIKCRQIAKQPEITLQKAYRKLQHCIKKDPNFEKGVYWGKHFYKNIYYDRRIDKIIWGDFDHKEHQIQINTIHHKT